MPALCNRQKEGRRRPDRAHRFPDAVKRFNQLVMAADDTPLIRADALTAFRGERRLFEGLDLTLSPGQAIVLRGANGAGKTTLLRILAGLTRPETGRVVWHGSFHWIGHREGLKPNETPRSHLRLWAQAWGSRADTGAILAGMALRRAADVQARYLSAGQRRRAALARLQLEERPVWLLDEPYTALDKESRSRLDDSISAHLAGGGGVIASMHDHPGFGLAGEVVL